MSDSGLNALLDTVARFTSADDAEEERAEIETDRIESQAMNEEMLDVKSLDELIQLIKSTEKLEGFIQSLERNGERHLNSLGDYAHSGDRVHFLETLHTLKGSSGTLGLKGVVELCREIEAALEHPGNPGMAAYASNLSTVFHLGCQSLRGYLEQYRLSH